jgi:hypothetical protein
MTAEADVTVVDWDSFDLEEFTRELRGNLDGPDADKLIWAFEHARSDLGRASLRGRRELRASWSRSQRIRPNVRW